MTPTTDQRERALEIIGELDKLDTYIRVVHEGRVPDFVEFIIHKIQPHLPTIKAALTAPPHVPQDDALALLEIMATALQDMFDGMPSKNTKQYAALIAYERFKK